MRVLLLLCLCVCALTGWAHGNLDDDDYDNRAAKSSRGLRRQKRAWVIPPINYPENDRGPFPKPMVQIRSDGDTMPLRYSITGPGANMPPVGLFTIDRNTGWLFVTRPLDREEKPFYTLQAHAVYARSGKLGEDPMDINVIVIDQNDNKPVFTQDTYLGQVPEASHPGTVVCTVNATDADEPDNDNSDIRYSILNQDPKTPADNLFAINPVSGAIRVNAGGLDREQFPKYTLDIQAKDLRGDGLSGKTKVILTVAAKSSRGLRRQKRAWVIPPINYPENDRGPFPKSMVQIRSDGGDEMPVRYSLTGRGANMPPVGLFTIDRNTGWLWVVQPLDREKESFYTLQVHAVQSGKLGEEPMDINVIVIDQNDNKPVFTQDTYQGQVPEASPPGTVVCTVKATDADAPGNDNSDIRYSILNQEPKTPADNLFAINPVSGAIRVNAGGLDRKPKYTLDIEAADLRGRGLSGKTKVILTVTVR